MRRILFLLIFVSNLGLTRPVFAEEVRVRSPLDPERAVHHFVHDSWDVEDGLPSYAINDILRTRDGYLWLATYDGAVRFDGVRFRVFNRQNTAEMPTSLVHALHEDEHGNLWFGSQKGLLRYQEGRILPAKSRLPDEDVTDFAQDEKRGGFWIGTRSGVAYFNGGVNVVYTAADGLEDEAVSVVSGARDGGLWVGTDYGSVYRFKDEEWTLFESFEVFRGVTVIHEDPQGNLWVGLSESVLRRFDGERWTEYPGLGFPASLHEDRAGTLWVGSQLGVVRFIAGQPETYEVFNVRDGLSDPRIYSIRSDFESNLWIGTYTGELNRLKDGIIRTFGERDGVVGERVHSIYEDEPGVYWVGTEKALVLMDGANVTAFSTGDVLTSDVRAILRDRSGQLWVGTKIGLSRFENGEFHSFRNDVGAVVSLVEDRDGRVWAAGEVGVVSWHQGEWTNHFLLDERVAGRITALQETRDGRLLIGRRQGLVVREGQELALVEELGTSWIRAFHEDDEGYLWIGTVGDGLYRWRNADLKHFTKLDGLPDDYVWDIVEDDRKRLWMSSDQGIFVVAREELNDFSLGVIPKLSSRRYDTTDGMKTAEGVGFVHPGAVRATDGGIWFPTMRGAVRVDPSEASMNHLVPPVLIESLVTGGETLEIGRAVMEVTLEPDQRDIEVHYTGLALRDAERVRFKFRLVGYADEWKDVGPRRTAYFTNLPPGDFVFQVIAANEDGVINETGASLALTRRPAFHETLWFYTLCLLAIVVAGISLLNFRVRNIRRRNRDLNALVGELEARNAEMERFVYTVSHDLRSPLVSIQGFLGLLEKDAEKKDTDAMRHDIDVLRGSARQMSDLLHDLLEYSRVGRVVNERSRISLNDLVTEAAGLVRGALDQRGVELSIQPSMPIVDVDRRRYLEVFQNLMENATKFYGDESSPTLEIGVLAEGSDEGLVTCFVRDNGIGIEPAYQNKIFVLFERLDASIEGTGVGLSLVKRIVEHHGGRVWAESSGLGHGTAFFLTIPLASEQ